MGIPLLLIGGMQCISGTTVAMRKSNDISRVEYQFNHEPQKIQSEELPRMETVLNHFIFHKWIEVILMLIGVFLFIRFFDSPQPFWKGLGLGLLLPAVILFLLDFIAEKRAVLYVDFLSGAV